MTSAAIITMSLLAAWLGVFVCAPRMLKSMSRHKLWQLRDEIVDAIIEGRVERSEAIAVLLGRIETAIQHAEKLSLWRLMFIPSPPSEVRGAMRAHFDKAMESVREQDKLAICEFYSKFYNLIMGHLSFTSPLGWCLVAIVVCVLPFALLRHGFRYAVAKGAIVLEKKTTPRVDVALARLSEQGPNHFRLAS
jgi:hypothetical protein